MMKHLDPTPLKCLTKGPQTSITRPGFSCVFRSVIWMTIHCYTCAPPTALSQLPTSSCHIAVAMVTILLQMCHTCVTSQTAKVTLPSTQLPVGVLVEWQGPFWTRELTQMSNHTQGEHFYRFFELFKKKLKPKKIQGWKKLKGIFWKTQAFSQKTQDFANSTW